MRIAGLWLLQARLAWRYGIVALFGALAVAWTGVLLALPPEAARGAVPWLLVLETAVLATTLVGALVILERDQGMQAALATSPARPGERLTALVGPTTGLTVAAAVPIALAGRVDRLWLVLAAVGLTALLTMLVSVAVAARRHSVLTYLVVLPLILLPLLVPAVAHGSGLGHPALYAVPTVAALDLARGGYGWPADWVAVAWLAVACLAAAVPARRRLRASHRAGPTGRSHPGGTAASPARGWVRALLRADLVSVSRDPMLVLVAATPVLVGLALRLGYPPLQRWLADAHGFALDPYRPLVVAAAIILVVQTFGMVGAMLVLDDVDDRAMVAVRTSPVRPARYLAYRAGLVAAAAAAAVTVAVVLSGLAGGHGARLASAVLLAGLVAPLFMLATLAIARNKVEGVTALKLLGFLLFAPLAAWWLPEPVGWAFAWLPTWWLAQAVWTSWPHALGGLVVTAALATVLTRRVLPRLRTV